MPLSWWRRGSLQYQDADEPRSGVARAPQAPRRRGARGAKGARQGPQGRSSRRNPLARGPNKLFAGGPKNRRYATGAPMHYNYVESLLLITPHTVGR